ncbi:MAG: radical SAM protein [Nitrospirae bacterium]|nr:radical SAM protein [Nitrospirota bacterium]
MNENNYELGFGEVVEKYPDFPRLLIRKLDAELRGVSLTKRALERAKEEGSLYDASEDLGQKTPRPVLGGALFRDGSWVLGMEPMYLQFPQEYERRGSSYTIDAINDGLWLLDGGEPVEEVFFVPYPEYFGKKTSRGTPMLKVVSARLPGLLFVYLYNRCHFWLEKKPCKYCSFPTRVLRKKHGYTQGCLDDLYETMNEALKEEGKWMNIVLLAGSDPTGNSPYDNEVDEYVKVLTTLRKSFGTEKVYAKMVASAFSREQLLRLKEAGATTYQPHIEVWDEKLFEWMCPGKAKYFGRQYWIDSALSAVEIFGRGYVCTQFVGGVELTQPYGFKTIDEALESTLEGAEFFARHGVGPIAIIHRLEKGSVFYREKQKPAPLEYYVRLMKGISDIHRKYDLSVDFNNYRCHPTGDLDRLHCSRTHSEKRYNSA